MVYRPVNLHPRGNYYSCWCNLREHLSTSTVTSITVSVSPLLNTSRNVIFPVLCIFFLTWQCNLGIVPHYYRQTMSFYVSEWVFQCMGVSQNIFHQPFLDGHLGCFQSLAIMTKLQWTVLIHTQLCMYRHVGLFPWSRIAEPEGMNITIAKLPPSRVAPAYTPISGVFAFPQPGQHCIELTF